MSQKNIDQLLNQLTSIFQEVFDNESLAIGVNTTAEDIDGWDSLTHIRLVISIEKALSLRFSAAEVSDLVNVGEMIELILKKQMIV